MKLHRLHEGLADIKPQAEQFEFVQAQIDDAYKKAVELVPDRLEKKVKLAYVNLYQNAKDLTELDDPYGYALGLFLKIIQGGRDL